jgi:hypothetical protein
VAKKEDSNGKWCLKIVLFMAVMIAALELTGLVGAALVFFAMMVLDKLDNLKRDDD